MTIKPWEQRQVESTEEAFDMPLAKWHFMQQEINDHRAREARMAELIAALDFYTPCMSYNDSYFGEPAGDLKRIIRQMVKAEGMYKEYQTVGKAESMPGTGGGFTMAVFKGLRVPPGTELFVKALPREITVHDYFDVPMEPDSEDGQDTLRKMAHYVKTGELPDHG